MGFSKTIIAGISSGIIVIVIATFILISPLESDIDVTIPPSENLRPNIIMIMTDDLDVNTLNQLLKMNWMPNLQKYIIDEGTDFTNSFVTNPVCCPSRSTFLTGQYSHNHGVLNNDNILELDDQHTLNTWLKKAGYTTGLVGKYLNGYGKQTDASYVPPGWDEWKVLVEPYHKIVYNYKISDMGTVVNYGESPSDYRTDVLASLATDFISQASTFDETPFFLFVSTRAPHDDEPGSCNVRGTNNHIIRPPERYEGTAKNLLIERLPSFNEPYVTENNIIQFFPLNEKDKDCIDLFIQKRMESMRAVDDLIGVISQALFDIEKFDNTVFIFTSDNGLLLGEHRLFKKKVFPYEESIRVPLYITAPEFRTMQDSPRLATNNDLAPTILELAGAAADISMDGRSLVPLLSDPNEEDWRDRFLVEQWSEICSKLDQWVEGDVLHERMSETYCLPITYKMIRTTSYVYIEYQDSISEFYDLETDPYQLENQINCTSTACKEKINELQNWLNDLKDCGQGTCQILENKP